MKCLNNVCSVKGKWLKFERHLVQFSHSVVSDSVTPWTAAHQASLSISNSWSPPKPMSIVSVMPSNHLIFCRPRLLPSIFPSIRVFSDESALRIRWPKYWSFSFNISPSNDHPGLISFRMDWLDVQGTRKSPQQQHTYKASILLCSACSIVQLLHPYMTTGKTIALTRVHKIHVAKRPCISYQWPLYNFQIYTPNHFVIWTISILDCF